MLKGNLQSRLGIFQKFLLARDVQINDLPFIRNTIEYCSKRNNLTAWKASTNSVWYIENNWIKNMTLKRFR